MKHAKAALETKDFVKRKEALDRDMALPQERQKLILLADKSPFGWKTVLEYKHHDLADNEEDRRRSMERNQGGPGLLSVPLHAQLSTNKNLFQSFSLRLLSSWLHIFLIFSLV